MKQRESAESRKALRMLAAGMLTGLGSVPLYALYAVNIGQFVVIWSVGSLLCGGAALVGGTLGFLFGIPRTLQQDEGNAPASTTPAQTPPRTVSYRANTNLEQISDWLTKILVGVGLTQIDALRQGFHDLTLQAAKGLGGHVHSQIYAAALIGFSVVLGFLFGYLWTRLHLAGALRLADQAAIGSLVESVQQASARAESASREIEGLKQQAEHDANALNLVYRQLNPSPDLPTITQDKLDQALKLASRPIRIQAFNQAMQMRSENWRREPAKMERTILIFRALIHHDVESRYHMNHGQLGFALKDKPDPDWLGAEQALSEAIRRRDAHQEKGWLYYELARAICRIRLDHAFGGKKPSPPEAQTRILEDLRMAARVESIRKHMLADPMIQAWLTLNQLGLDPAPADSIAVQP